MYVMYVIRDTIMVPPAEMGDKLENVLVKQARRAYEGLMDEDMGVIIAVNSVSNVGDGVIVPGDGSVYYEADIELLAYKPKIHELVEGVVTDVTEFGAFVKTGPLEGLVHVSQIMDDFINYDPKLPGFSGKETSKKLLVKDVVLARIVTVSLKGTISSSKIGLTMRQPGLGKPEWVKIDEREKAKKEAKKSSGKGEASKNKGGK